MKTKISILLAGLILATSLTVNADTNNRRKKRKRAKYRVSSQHSWRSVNIGRTCGKH